MNLPGSEAKKRIAAYVFGAVALLAVWYIYDEMWGGPSAPAPAAATAVSTPAANRPATTAGPAAKTLGKTSASLDPTLHMEAMLVTEAVTYNGTGRNIFSASSAPPPLPVNIPKPVAAVRPVAAATPPPPPQPTGPPPPPPIDLKFYGFFETPKTGEKQAILVHGDDQVLASQGEIVLRRYRVVAISPRSIQVEDMPYSNTQTLPLQTN